MKIAVVGGRESASGRVVMEPFAGPKCRMSKYGPYGLRSLWFVGLRFCASLFE